MERMNDAEARVVLSLLDEMHKAEAAVADYVSYVGQRHNINDPVLRRMPDGLYVCEKPRGEQKEKKTDG